MNDVMKFAAAGMSLLAAPVIAQTADLGASVRSNIEVSVVEPLPTAVVAGEGTSANIKRQIAAQRRYTSGKVYELVPPLQGRFFPGKSDAADTGTAPK